AHRGVLAPHRRDRPVTPAAAGAAADRHRCRRRRSAGPALGGGVLVVAGGRVIGADRAPAELDVVCADGEIVELRSPGSRVPAGATTIDATGRFVAPGFLDLQINGGFGHDFTTSPDSIARVAEQLPR